MKMNRLKVIAWLTAFLIVFCSVTLLSTWHVRKQMRSLVEKARTVNINDNSSSEDIERIKPMLDKIEETWSKYEPTVSMYSRHDEIERVTEEIEWLKPLYDNGYYTQLNVKLVGINDALDHLLQTEQPSLANIF